MSTVMKNNEYFYMLDAYQLLKKDYSMTLGCADVMNGLFVLCCLMLYKSGVATTVDSAIDPEALISFPIVRYLLNPNRTCL